MFQHSIQVSSPHLSITSMHILFVFFSSKTFNHDTNIKRQVFKKKSEIHFTISILCFDNSSRTLKTHKFTSTPPFCSTRFNRLFCEKLSICQDNVEYFQILLFLHFSLNRLSLHIYSLDGLWDDRGEKKPAFKKEDLGSALHYPDTWDKTAPH